MTFFDCTADLVLKLNGNGQKGMLQIDTVENLSLRHCLRYEFLLVNYDARQAGVTDYVFADAADHCALESAETARPNHDHVGLFLRRQAT